MATASLAGKLEWEHIEYLGIALFPTLLLIFALQLAGHGELLSRSWVGLGLAAIPTFTLLGIWTDSAHELFFTGSRLERERGVDFLVQERGPLFSLHATYSYLLVLAAIVLLLGRVRRSAPRDRGRALLVVVGGLAPLAGNAIYLAGLSPIRAFDWTPLLLCATAAAAMLGSWRGAFLEVVPVSPAAVLERMTEGVMVFDRYDRLVDLNLAAERLLGGARDALLQRSSGDLLGRWPAITALARESGARTLVEIEPGRWFEVLIDELRDHRGRATASLLLWRDASMRMGVESRLRHEMEQSRRRADREHLLFELLRAAGGSLDESEGARRVVATIADRTPWRNVAIGVATPDNDALRFLAGSHELAQLLAEPISRGIAFRALSTGATQLVDDVGGDPDYVAASAATRAELALPLRRGERTIGAINIESDEPASFSPDDVALMESIADVVALGLENARLHRAVVERNRELEDLERLREDMTRTLVHDLRNPAFAVVGLAEQLAEEAPELSSENRRHLELIRESGDRLLTLASSILEITRLEARTMPIEPIELDLAALVARVVERHGALAAPRRVELAVRAEPQLPRAFADPRLIERVFENLIGNAVKFSPIGSRIEAALAAAADAGAVRVEIRDQGPGVSPKVRPRLFEMFARGDESNAGTGLGLAFCRLAVEANGGSIRLADERVEPGATFVVVLPTHPVGRHG